MILIFESALGIWNFPFSFWTSEVMAVSCPTLRCYNALLPDCSMSIHFTFYATVIVYIFETVDQYILYYESCIFSTSLVSGGYHRINNVLDSGCTIQETWWNEITCNGKWSQFYQPLNLTAEEAFLRMNRLYMLWRDDPLTWKLTHYFCMELHTSLQS